MFIRKALGFRQLLNLQAIGLAKLDALFNIKDCFATAEANVSMNWRMLVRVEEKSVAVLFFSITSPSNEFSFSLARPNP